MKQRTLQLWQRETVLTTQQSATRHTGSPQTRQKAESFLRDLAFVLKMTEKVKESMIEATCQA